MNNKNLIDALVKAQAQISAPKKAGENPVYRSKYATLDNVLNSIKEPLKNNGLALSHSVEMKDGSFFLKTILMHQSGEILETFFPMILEKTTNQGIGSARTYACRYAICSLFSIPGDEDDDANSADGLVAPESEDKKEIIREIFEMIGNDPGKRKWILSQNSKFYKTEFTSFNEMSEDQLKNVLNFLKKGKGAA